MPRSRSTSPRQSHSSSPRPRGRPQGSGGALVVQRVVKEVGGSAAYPTLTRTNYGDWSLMMKVMLQARGLWDAVETGGAELQEDRMALEAILRVVPPEMISTLAVKASAKEAWDAVKTMRVGIDRVRKAKAQQLRKEYEGIGFRAGETVDDFAMRLTGVVNQLSILGDPEPSQKVVEKFLRVVPSMYSQIALSIETLLDLSTLSIEEVTGRLKAVEDRFPASATNGADGKLLLTEEEWITRMQERKHGEGSPSGSKSGNRRRKQGRKKPDAGGTSDGKPGAGRDISKDKCHNCGKMGHWARTCRSKPKRTEQAHLTQVDDDEPTLLMASVNVTTDSPPLLKTNPLRLEEVRALVQLDRAEERDADVWYLDTGATNHMTGSRAAFSELDANILGTVKFGDGSIVDIEGRGKILFACKTGEHRALTGVYYIPRLTSNIISIGQLVENGCQVLIDGGTLRIRDQERRLLARVKRSPNRLYMLKLDIT